MKFGVLFDYKESWMMTGVEINDDKSKILFYYNGAEDDFEKSYELMELKTDKIIKTTFKDYDEISEWEEKNNTEVPCLNIRDINEIIANYQK